MSWNHLVRLGVTCRPIDVWPGRPTPPSERQSSRFDAPMSATVELLTRELKMLEAERIVLQVDLRPSQIRVDGLPRADARAASPGVILGFDSMHGPLRYACDRFRASMWKREGGEDWQHNLRAIALGLEALRTVDRYGISKRGEQYRGYAELPAGIAQPATHMTTDEAARMLLELAGYEDMLDGETSPRAVLHDVGPHKVYRAAAVAAHPDTGGDAVLFQRLQAAKALLDREDGRG